MCNHYTDLFVFPTQNISFTANLFVRGFEKTHLSSDWKSNARDLMCCTNLLLLSFWILDGLVDVTRPINSFGSQPWHSCHKLIYVRPNPKTGVPVGHWPIPESFWPDQNSPTLVCRSAFKLLCRYGQRKCLLVTIGNVVESSWTA